jgi:Tol biopolymer transport system component
MAYVVDGNLYFQDSGKPTSQLTYDKVQDPEYRRLISFSEDGDRIFYFQGSRQENLYSIHVDGTQEQALLSNSLLLTLSSEYDEATTLCRSLLVPHTSFVLVRTCTHSDVNIIILDELLLVDTDTGKTKVLLPPGKGGRFYTPSPDGSMVAFSDSGRVHIIGINGKMVRRNLATYVPGDRYDPDAIDALIYWLPDSSGLILALPIRTVNDPGLLQTYEIYRYSLDTSIVTQISFVPPVTGTTPVRVSLDGNWITYTNRDEGVSYLGNLQDGHTYSYGPADLLEWSPDSMHFLYISYERNKPGVYLASIHEPSTLLFGKGEYFYRFAHWLDASRYVYLGDGGYAMREVGGDSMLVLFGNIRSLLIYENIIFHYQPSSE